MLQNMNYEDASIKWEMGCIWMGLAKDTVEGGESESIFLPDYSQNQVANFLF